MMQVGSRFNESFTSLDLDDLDPGADDERSMRERNRKLNHDEGAIPLADGQDYSYEPTTHAQDQIKTSGSAMKGTDKVVMSVLLENERPVGSENTKKSKSPAKSKTARSQTSEPSAPHAKDTDNESLKTIETHTTKGGKKKVSLTSLIANQKGAHILERIDSHPRSLRRRHDIELNGKPTRAHPLHHLVSMKPPVKVVNAFIDIYPEACRLPDEIFGQLPLHVACNFGASSSVLKCLLQAFPSAAKLTDVDDRLPLHYACHDGHPNNVSVLIAANKSALTARDSSGMTPIDLCQESESPQRDEVLNLIYYEVSKEYGMEFEKTKQNKRSPSEPDSEVSLPSHSESTGDSLKGLLYASSKTESTFEMSSSRSDVHSEPESNHDTPSKKNGESIQDVERESSVRTLASSNKASDKLPRNRDSLSLLSKTLEKKPLETLELPSKATKSKPLEKTLDHEDSGPDLDTYSCAELSDPKVEPTMNGEDRKSSSPQEQQQQMESVDEEEDSDFDDQGTIYSENEVEHRNLEFRKVALEEECNHVKESIAKKKAQAQASKENMSQIKSKIRELQEAFEQEQKAFDIAVSGVKVYEEILLEHEAKVQAVDKELFLRK